tara:strand:+ start:662 stop:1801 length:1140 start_codon:yes stop_codon:yes gene_type:complete
MPEQIESASENDAPTSMEAAFDAAFEKHEAQDGGDNNDNTPAEASEQGAPPTDQEESGRSESQDTPQPVGDEAAQEPEAEAATPAEAPEAEPEPVAAKKTHDITKAPGHWKPGAREKWAELPEDVREEIKHRESKLGVAETTSAKARKFQEEFDKTITPYIPAIQASGVSNPMEAINGLLSTAAGLQMGTPHQKAQGIAKLIQGYGVSIEELDNILSGQPQEQSQPNGQNSVVTPDVQQYIDAQLQPFKQAVQQRQQSSQQQINDTISQFAADPANEFFNDVKMDMSHIMTSAARNGVQMDMKTAYDQACRFHPEVSKVLDQRSLAANAKANNKRFEEDAHAASSIQGDPGGMGGGAPVGTDMDSAINAAWDQAMNSGR